MNHHPLLARQLKRLGIDAHGVPTKEGFQAVLAAIDRAYAQADDDRYTLERSLLVSGEEMRGLYETLNREELTRRRQAEAQLGALVANVPGAVYCCRADETRPVLTLSDGFEAIGGVSAANFLARDDRTLGALVHPDDQAEVGQVLREAITSRESYAIKYRLVALDGSVHWVLDCGRRVVSDDSVFLFGVILDDSTQHSALEEARAARIAAEKATKAKSEFLANMSHELRTPLNAVIGLSGLLLEEQLSAHCRELADMLRRSASVLLELIDDVLDFSKIEANKLEIEAVDFSIDDVIEHVLSVVAPRAATKHLELGAVVAADVPILVRGDPGRVRQVVLNFANNAVKFTHEGQVRIDVSCIQSDCASACLRFEVSDTGIGIAAEARDRLFQPFTQADASSTRQFGGTGLGLAISKQLAACMGGRVGMESTLGQGSTFWFEVRLAVLRPAGEPALLGKRFVVVESSAAGRSLLCSQLEALGAWTMPVDSAALALKALETCKAQGLAVDGIFAVQLDPRESPETCGALRRAFSGNRLVELLPIDAAPGTTPGRTLRKPVSSGMLRDAVTGAAMEARRVSSAPRARFEDATVLVVEDNHANQRVLKLQLEKLGISVDLASNGQEALQALALRRYGLVFMDCQMPVMDGIEATRTIRLDEQKSGQHIPIVALTAHAMPSEMKRCMAAGMDTFLTKPVSMSQLEGCLSGFLEPSSTPKQSGCTSWVIDDLLEVGGPQLVQNLLDSWRERDAGRLDMLQQLVAERDRPKAHPLCHSLHGVAAVTGLETLGHALGRLEEQLKSASWDAAIRLASELRTHYEHDITAVERTLEHRRRAAG
jgi:two-component system sensor histidine kinase/response regulator